MEDVTVEKNQVVVKRSVKTVKAVLEAVTADEKINLPKVGRRSDRNETTEVFLKVFTVKQQTAENFRVRNRSVHFNEMVPAKASEKIKDEKEHLRVDNPLDQDLT